MRRLGPALLTVLLCAALVGCSDDGGTDTTDPGPSDQATSTPTSTPTSESPSQPTGEPTSQPTTEPTDEPTTEPTGEPTTGPTDGPTTAAAEVVDVLHATAAGGRVSDQFLPVDQEEQLAYFLSQLSDDAFAQQVRAAVEQAMRKHDAAYVAVVAIGCDVPPVDVEVTAEGEYVPVVGKVADPQVECFAPVTTVAVVAAG